LLILGGTAWNCYCPSNEPLWAATLLAEALVVVRLLWERLLGRYPLFAAFLAVDVVNNVVTLTDRL